MKLMQREMRYLQFIFQRHGDLIHLTQLLAHAISTLDTGSPMILSGWDVTATTNQHIIIQNLDEYTSGVRRGKWREIFQKKIYQHYENGCFLPATSAQESKEWLKKHWQYWENHTSVLLNTLSI